MPPSAAATTSRRNTRFDVWGDVPCVPPGGTRGDWLVLDGHRRDPMADEKKRDRLSPPLMHIFRTAARGTGSPAEETGARSGLARVRSLQRMPITEQNLRREVSADLVQLLNCVALEFLARSVRVPGRPALDPELRPPGPRSPDPRRVARRGHRQSSCRDDPALRAAARSCVRPCRARPCSRRERTEDPLRRAGRSHLRTAECPRGIRGRRRGDHGKIVINRL